MAGKDKIERSFRVTWDDSGGTPRDITVDLLPGTMTGGGRVLDEVDMTGVSEALYHFLGGHARSPVAGQFHMSDVATTGAFTVMKDTVNVVGTLSLEWGANGAAPIAGDPKWEGEYVLLSDNIGESGGRSVINASWQPAGSQADPVWGVVT